MKYNKFEKQAELIKSRLIKIDSDVQLLSIKDNLTRIESNKLKILSEDAKSKRNDFETSISKLIAFDSAEDIDLTKLSQLQEEISDLCINIFSVSETLLTTPSNTETMENFGFNYSPKISHIKLPELKLIHFSGKETEWIPFYNFFESTIHKNDSLSNVDKFAYLTSCLSDQALALIKSLSLTNDNYLIARQTLIDRYENSRVIISSHISNILNLPDVSTPSAECIRHFLNSFSENSNALKALNINIEEESLLLVTIILRKLCSELLNKFEHARIDSKKMPSFQELKMFLETECNQLEAAALTSRQIKSSSVNKRTLLQPNFNSSLQPICDKRVSHQNRKSVLLSDTRPNLSIYTCPCCNKMGHKVYNCEEFIVQSPQQRFEFVKSHSLCTNCLGTNHKYTKCQSKHVCSKCQAKHHTLLHFTNDNNKTFYMQTKPTSTDKNLMDQQSKQSTLSNQNNKFVGVTSSNSTVLLATTLVSLSSHNGNQIVCRAVLDSAGAATFISEHIAHLLKLPRTFSGLPQVCGLSSAPVKTNGRTQVNISSLSGSLLVSNHSVLVLNKISSELPSAHISPQVKNQLKHLILADPNFDTPATIDMLIGADLFAQTLTGKQISLGDDMPTAMETVFGFVLLGPSPSLQHRCFPIQDVIPTMLCTNDLELHNSIQRFWIHEEPPVINKLSECDKRCEQFFNKTHFRDSSGRYTVRLPFKNNPECLGKSADLALKMLKSIERKFSLNSQYKQMYTDFMQDYLDTGHMQPIESFDINNPHYFIPHHGVLKNNKIRVVFNASCPTSTGISLNNILYQGPKLHNNITDILFGFRRHTVVFSCDVKQMFRQVRINDQDLIYQLIYWRKTPEEPLSIFKLTTVTYGMSSSPYLANKVIQQLIKDEEKNYPLASKSLKDQIYVDDVLLGAESIDHALKLKNEIVELLKKGGFELRKWSSNRPELLLDIPVEHCEQVIHFRTEEQSSHSLLGLRWNPTDDYFSYSIGASTSSSTKRSVLSLIGKIYDPIGLLTPVTFWAKALMQLIWTLSLSWDEPLPVDLSNNWLKFVKKLILLNKIKIPRQLLLAPAKTVELHGFGDASQTGYAACVYLRCINYENRITVQLLIAKSRVAPLKRISLPRLELCAAHLTAKLLQYCNIKISLHYNVNSITAWSDSTIALTWIQTPSYRLKVYVSNRVADIQELIPSSTWKHVSSQDNPADCASRGILPDLLMDHPLWWTGPFWLSLEIDKWPTSLFVPLSENSVTEIKTTPLTALASSTIATSELLNKYSNWRTLQHVVAYIFRFSNNCRSKSEKQLGVLSLRELNYSTEIICRLIQKQCFNIEIDALKNGKQLPPRVQGLNPFVDEHDTIRVGGRLRNAKLEFPIKHPILLPKKHHVVSLIIDYYHQQYLHCGPIQLQSLLFMKFWILSARSAIRYRIFRCISCYKTKPKNSTALMGDLPEGRVIPSRPFTVSGVDYTGPFTIKLLSLRKLQPIKVYICLFICFCTKAVHLEVVMDLTSEAFIAALTRFVSRRGFVSSIHCDNATNFVGAQRQLHQVFQELTKKKDLQTFLEKSSLTFHFNPPRAPHHGGLWERAVKSAKTHLKKVLGNHIPTLEEFWTITTRIEAMLNSRPITPLSSDPSEMEALTPGHFLVNGPLVTLHEPNLTDLKINRLRRWQVLQAYTQNIWSRWSREYLHTLQQRSKWTQNKPNIKIGDLAVLHESNLPPLCWKLARVKQLYPGKDGVVRVVQLTTSDGTFTRPITRISILPIE